MESSNQRIKSLVVTGVCLACVVGLYGLRSSPQDSNPPRWSGLTINPQDHSLSSDRESLRQPARDPDSALSEQNRSAERSEENAEMFEDMPPHMGPIPNSTDRFAARHKAASRTETNTMAMPAPSARRERSPASPLDQGDRMADASDRFAFPLDNPVPLAARPDHQSETRESETRESETRESETRESETEVQLFPQGAVDERAAFPSQPNSWSADQNADRAAVDTHPEVFDEPQQGNISPLAHPPRLSEAAQRRSWRHVEYGQTLARRGAIHAAREEFIAALRTIAEALDQSSGTRAFSQALAEGFTSIDEADDFARRSASSYSVTDVDRLVRGHRTPVLKEVPADSLTPAQALEAYYRFAESRLWQASGGQPAAGRAFSALGRSFNLSDARDIGAGVPEVPKSLVMFRLAVATNPSDHYSLNELGVLLAQAGHWPQAKEYLLASLRAQPTPAAWSNLADVHQVLGETHLAQLARREYEQLRQHPQVAHTADLPVRWVDAEEMEALAPAAEASFQYPAREASHANQESPEKKNWLRSFTEWF